MLRIKVDWWDSRNFGITLAALPAHEYAYTLDLVRAFPERKFVKKYDTWRVPATPTNVRHLRTAFRDDEMEVSADAKTLLEYHTLTEASATEREKRRWEYVFDGKVPDYAWSCTKRNPYKHQIVAADAARGQEFFAHLMEQGTGKTFVSVEELVTAAKAFKAQGRETLRAFIVCPRTLRQTWADEIQASLPPDFKAYVGILRGKLSGADELLRGLKAPADMRVWILTYERVGSLLDALMAMEPHYIVADEATAMKNPSAKRTKNMLKLAEVSEFRRILTGTIMANRIFDVFAPFEFLQRGCLGYSSYNEFQNRYGEFRKVKEWTKLVGVKNLDELKERMARLSMIVRKDQCLDLPPKSYQVRRVPMSDEQAAAYIQMAEYCAAVMDPSLGEEGVGTARAMIAQMLRFSQITSGYLPTPAGIIRFKDGDAKAEATYDIVDDAEGKVLVWCRFREDIRHLRAYLEEEGIRCAEIHGGVGDDARDRAVRDFNADNDIKVLIGQPGTGGMGLTLLGPPEQRCRTVVYYSNEWSLQMRLQSEDRCHRIGQNFPVMYYDLVAEFEDGEGTIDDVIVSNLRGKRTLADALKDVSSIRELLLTGRRTQDHDVGAPAERDADTLRAMLRGRGVRLPIPLGSHPKCADNDHEDRDGSPLRCEWCSGDPMTVIIGDSEADVLAGKRAGIATVLFEPVHNRTYANIERAAAHGPDIRIAHFSELVPALIACALLG
jgi:hypothetical protein